jgi:hypothetical protein
MGVTVACGIGSGIIVAVNMGGVEVACGNTIVAVGEIGIGVGEQELRKNKKVRKFDARFI